MLLPPLLQAKLMRRRVLPSAVGAAPSALSPFSASVISFQDGDGFTVSAAGSLAMIRLWGMDAPEWGQHYARQSWQFLASLVWGKPVFCVPVTRDRFGRLVCDCYGLQPYPINLIMILHGYAWHCPNYAPEAVHLRDAMRLAKLNKRGLWAKPNPMPPWCFRHSQRLRRSFSHG